MITSHSLFQAMFLNVVYKSLKIDTSLKRVKVSCSCVHGLETDPNSNYIISYFYSSTVIYSNSVVFIRYSETIPNFLCIIFQAFVKRLLQVCSTQPPAFVCGVLYLLSEV